MGKEFRISWMRRCAEAMRLKFPSSGARAKAAAAIDISRQMHHKMEYGDTDPAELQFKTMAKIALLLELSLNDIAEHLGIVPLGTLTQVELNPDVSLEGLIMESDASETVEWVANYLRRLLGSKRLDWRDESQLKSFAYGPGEPGAGTNVWREDELPRLVQLIEGEVDKVKASDYFRLARCVSALLGEKISVQEFIEMAKDGNPSGLEVDLGQPQ